MSKIVIKGLDLTNFFALHAQKSNSICFSVSISIFSLDYLNIFFIQFLASLQKILNSLRQKPRHPKLSFRIKYEALFDCLDLTHDQKYLFILPVWLCHWFFQGTIRRISDSFSQKVANACQFRTSWGRQYTEAHSTCPETTPQCIFRSIFYRIT